MKRGLVALVTPKLNNDVISQVLLSAAEQKRLV